MVEQKGGFKGVGKHLTPAAKGLAVSLHFTLHWLCDLGWTRVLPSLC